MSKIKVLQTLSLLALVSISTFSFTSRSYASDIPKNPSLAQHAPDIFFQFSMCIPANLLDKFVQAIKTYLLSIPEDPNREDSPPRFPDPHIRTNCAGDKQNVGIWVRNDPSLIEERDQAYKSIDVVRDGLNNFYISIRGSFIDRESKMDWEKAPKDIDGAHLSHFVVRFSSPSSPQKIIQTVIFGVYDALGPANPDFQYVTTDTLSLVNSRINCDSTHWLSLDASGVRAFWYGLTTSIFAPLLPVIIEKTEGYIGSAQKNDFNAGVGCLFASILVPEVMIPGPLQIGPLNINAPKILFNHDRLDVSPDGISTQGTINIVERSPKITITGPIQSRTTGNTVTEDYKITPYDLLGPLDIRWTSEGTIANPTGLFTSIEFPTRDILPGQSSTKRITVQATDADNLSAEGAIDTFIYRERNCGPGREWDPIFLECFPVEPHCKPGFEYDPRRGGCYSTEPELLFE